MRSNRGGLSLIELLVFVAIFVIVAVTFMTILVSIIRVQSRQFAVGEVTQQSQFLLQRIQYFVERSSLVEMSADAPTTTLKLRMAATSEDPTYIYLSSSTVFLKQTDGGSSDPLTSDKVLISNLNFTKRSNPPGHDSVSTSFTVTYNTQSIGNQFSQVLQTAVARVSAATFDSSINPSSTDAFAVGRSDLRWQSINGVLFFTAANPPNVGIGASAPGAKFQVSGGDIYVDTTSPILRGIILRSSNGACWRVTPSTTGTLLSASLTCP